MTRDTVVRVLVVGVGLSIGVGCGDSSDDRPARKTGEIGVTVSPSMSNAWAVYREPVESPCGDEEFGDCTFWESCFDGNVSTIPPTEDPGTVTVQGTPLALDASGQIYLSLIEAAIRPSDVVEMSAAGSDAIPPHAGNVVVPPLITMLEPSLDSVVVIDRARDLEVTWTAVAEGSVGVRVTVLFASAGSANVNCYAPAARGRLTMPARALARLPPTDALAGMSGTLSVSQGNRVKVEAGEWDVWLITQEGAGGADAEIL